MTLRAQPSAKKLLSKRRKEYEDSGYASSDSETEAGPKPSHQARRRRYKADQLAALVGSMLTLSSDDQKFREEVGKKRLRDNTARRNKRQMYDEDTRIAFGQVGEQFKRTSFGHNPYLRRAFRRAVPKEKMLQGGSDAYNAAQGKIRQELHHVLAKDHKKMQWQKADFPDPETWQGVQFLLSQPASNASTGDTFQQRVEAGADPTGSQARIGFHHIAWKEAGYWEHALNPYNLTALNDWRERLNPAKRAKLAAAGKSQPVGAHDAFGHQSSGFMTTEANRHRGRPGGHFVAIDHEAVAHELERAGQPRKRKKDIYQVG